MVKRLPMGLPPAKKSRAKAWLTMATRRPWSWKLKSRPARNGVPRVAKYFGATQANVR